VIQTMPPLPPPAARQGEVSGLVGRDRFRPLRDDRYTNADGKPGRPDELLVLQQRYGLPDPEPERQATGAVPGSAQLLSKEFETSRKIQRFRGRKWPR